MYSDSAKTFHGCLYLLVSHTAEAIQDAATHWCIDLPLIKATINSHPLAHIITDISELEARTPVHFLPGRHAVTVPDHEVILFKPGSREL